MAVGQIRLLRASNAGLLNPTLHKSPIFSFHLRMVTRDLRRDANDVVSLNP